ncbi:hypothetical protein [Tannerella forsythia]|uniref:Uncharacterized protein n=1 Tax=Tannerella forsythia TaxID=28112 RepID=A0A3P1YVR4_TANFO|nr:hypothetical protein [Tannerella forsythia]RRD75019.1 hypothetical protein EII41_07095 [Tannerella forsythia]
MKNLQKEKKTLTKRSNIRGRWNNGLDHACTLAWSMHAPSHEPCVHPRTDYAYTYARTARA